MINLDHPYCVYVTSHPSGKYYIGKSQPNKIMFESYVGSGNKLHLQFTNPGFEIDTWTTRIIQTFESEDQAYECEAELVNLNTLLDTNCLNDKVGGRSGGYLSSIVKKDNHTINAVQSDIIIRNTTIRMDAQGRYCLNDIHKAAGGLDKDRPGHWTRNAKTQSYIKYLVKKTHSSCTNLSDSCTNLSDTIVVNPLVSFNSSHVGTYAVENLAIDYAAWISTSFKDDVYNAYKESIKKKTVQAEQTIQELQHSMQTKQSVSLEDKLNLNLMWADMFGTHKVETMKVCSKIIKRETGVSMVPIMNATIKGLDK